MNHLPYWPETQCFPEKPGSLLSLGQLPQRIGTQPNLFERHRSISVSCCFDEKILAFIRCRTYRLSSNWIRRCSWALNRCCSRISTLNCYTTINMVDLSSKMSTPTWFAEKSAVSLAICCSKRSLFQKLLDKTFDMSLNSYCVLSSNTLSFSDRSCRKVRIFITSTLNFPMDSDAFETTYSAFICCIRYSRLRLNSSSTSLPLKDGCKTSSTTVQTVRTYWWAPVSSPVFACNFLLAAA